MFGLNSTQFRSLNSKKHRVFVLLQINQECKWILCLHHRKSLRLIKRWSWKTSLHSTTHWSCFPLPPSLHHSWLILCLGNFPITMNRMSNSKTHWSSPTSFFLSLFLQKTHFVHRNYLNHLQPLLEYFSSSWISSSDFSCFIRMFFSISSLILSVAVT